MTQLELFESMGNQVDETSEVYKKYRLNILAQQMSTGTYRNHQICPRSADHRLCPHLADHRFCPR